MQYPCRVVSFKITVHNRSQRNQPDENYHAPKVTSAFQRLMMKSTLKLVDIAVKSSRKQTKHCIFDSNAEF